MGIDPEALKRLVQDHDVDPDFDMQGALHAAYSLYTILSKMPKDQRAQKDQLKKLAKKAKNLVTAIDEFDEALIGFDSLSQNPADNPRFGLRRDVERQKEQVKQNAISWKESANMAHAAIGKLKTGGGDSAFNALIDLLIDVYVVSTRKEPAYPSNDPVRSGRGGPMFRFIEDCLDFIPARQRTNDALGSIIDRVLDSRKQ